MAVQASVALGAAQLNACARDLKRQARFAKFLTDRQSFDFCKLSEIPNAEASSRLVTNVTDQVSCGKIIPVKLLLIRALLFSNIHSAPNRRDPHHVFKAAGDRHRKVVTFGSASVAVIERGVLVCIP